MGAQRLIISISLLARCLFALVHIGTGAYLGTTPDWGNTVPVYHMTDFENILCQYCFKLMQSTQSKLQQRRITINCTIFPFRFAFPCAPYWDHYIIVLLDKIQIIPVQTCASPSWLFLRWPFHGGSHCPRRLNGRRGRPRLQWRLGYGILMTSDFYDSGAIFSVTFFLQSGR